MKINVHCGQTVEKLTDREYHPYSAVQRALKAVKLNVNNKIFYSNNPDFIQSIKCLGEKYKIEVEFFLNGISTGDNIDPIFEDFNKSYEFLNELLEENL